MNVRFAAVGQWVSCTCLIVLLLACCISELTCRASEARPSQQILGISVQLAAAVSPEVEVTTPPPEAAIHGSLSLWWTIPFVGLLLSIALFPLLAPHFWHHHFGKVALFWSLCFVFAFLAREGTKATLAELMTVAFADYIPFIVLLFALYTIAGGVRLTGRLAGTPTINTVLLALGTLTASCTGTTGAAMLFIRPVLRANEWRKYKVHTVIFFVFLVANIGGSLTPLGDPPLFLGFLQGVSFFWPTVHLLGPMMLMTGALLTIYYCWDSILFRKEGTPPISSEESLRVEGKRNLLLLLGVIGAVLLSGVWRPAFQLPAIAGLEVKTQNIVRDLLLLFLAAMSWMYTSQASRAANGFSWFPIVEVAKLFAGIFVTIVPVIQILKEGTHGALGSLVELVSKNEQPVPAMYFWMAGLLSSFLDNAPTYLVFFNTAGGNPEVLMHEGANTLLAISAGAVFFGANTYIGNAPNFMVRAIAEERGIKMPGFFRYMIYSIGILIPLFGVVSWIWFR
jgi:Na+/H+ antiporter NhaD/arsenite permease-like protein